jgi:hypothetical protein
MGLKMARSVRCALGLVVVAALWQAPAAGAAIGTPIDLGSNETNVSSASITMTTTAAAPAGASIVVAAGKKNNGGGGPGPASCSDSGGNAYTTDAVLAAFQDTTSICSTHQLAGTLPSGSTITVTWSLTNGTGDPQRVRAFAVTGLGGPAPLDRKATASGVDAAPSSGAAPLTNQPNELLVGVIFNRDDSVGTAGFAPGSNGTTNNCAATGTPAYSAFPGLGSVSGALFQMHCTVGALGSYAAKATFSGTASWRAALATYRAAPEPATGPSGPSGQTPTALPADSSCAQLRKKLRRQRGRHAHTLSAHKSAQIGGNIKNTQRRLRRHNC